MRWGRHPGVLVSAVLAANQLPLTSNTKVYLMLYALTGVIQTQRSGQCHHRWCVPWWVNNTVSNALACHSCLSHLLVPHAAWFCAAMALTQHAHTNSCDHPSPGSCCCIKHALSLLNHRLNMHSRKARHCQDSLTPSNRTSHIGTPVSNNMIAVPRGDT
jgi:hypothetical protein